MLDGAGFNLNIEQVEGKFFLTSFLGIVFYMKKAQCWLCRLLIKRWLYLQVFFYKKALHHLKYQVYLQHIIIYIQMGKKLRNRTINDTESQESLNFHQSMLMRPLITKKHLRQLNLQRLTKPLKGLNKKGFNFIQRMQSSQINAIIDESKLQCPICLQIMIAPSMLLCGHMYCLRCLESNNAHSQRCCLCRNQQKNNRFINHPMADKLINKLVQQETDLTIKYLCRTTDSNEWLKRRKLSNIKQGLVIDYQDNSNLWRRGVITEIKNDQKLILRIKYIIKGQELFEHLEVDSRRLAPYTFFTRNKYLEEFQTCLPEYDLYEKQLENLQYKSQELDEQFIRFSRFEQLSEENDFFQLQNVNVEGQNLLNEALQLFDVSPDRQIHEQIFF